MTDKELQEIERKAMENDPEVYGPICQKLIAEIRCLRDVIHDSEATLRFVTGRSDISDEQRVQEVRDWLREAIAEPESQ